MKLLSLALEYAPEKSKKVIKEINKNDKVISKLAGNEVELAETEMPVEPSGRSERFANAIGMFLG